MSPPIRLINVSRSKSAISHNHCATCSLRDRCLPMGLNEADMAQLGKIIGHRQRVRRGEHLYRMNDPFTAIYAIQLGHFKTLQIDDRGAEHIVGFQMTGELLGMDAISNERHHCDSVALEDSEVCAIPFNRLELLFTQIPQLSHHFQRLMSQEITHNQSKMLLLGNMHAGQRLAAFLVNLASRYEMRGYSALRFQLRMSREDIGNHLNLTIESISRLLTRFGKQGLLKVGNRELEIIDPVALKNVATGSERILPMKARMLTIPPRINIVSTNAVA